MKSLAFWVATLFYFLLATGSLSISIFGFHMGGIEGKLIGFIFAAVLTALTVLYINDIKDFKRAKL